MKKIFVDKLVRNVEGVHAGDSFSDFVERMDSLDVDGLIALVELVEDNSEKLLLSLYVQSLVSAEKNAELLKISDMVVDKLLEVVEFADEEKKVDKVDFLRPAEVYRFMEQYFGLELEFFQVENIKAVMSGYPYDRFNEAGQRALREYFEGAVESFRFTSEEAREDMIIFLNENYGCEIDSGVESREYYHLDAGVLEKRSLSKSKLAEFFGFFPKGVVSIDKGTASSHVGYTLFGKHKFVIPNSTVKRGNYYAKFLLDSLTYSVQDRTVTMFRDYTYGEYEIVVSALNSFNDKNGEIFKFNNDESDEKAS